MKVCVVSLTRDRLDYTQHCFRLLHQNAGCWFDHYVLDQGSADSTVDWLLGGELDFQHVEQLDQNIGINRGLNMLLDAANATDDYDVFVKVDNDCEITVKGTVRDTAELAVSGQAILSPRVEGLEYPPGAQGEYLIDGERILDIGQIGGLFMAIPASVFDVFVYDDNKLLFDDVDICWSWRKHGGRCGYVDRLTVNHHETTVGQRQRYPAYFARKDAEYRTARRR